LRNVEENGNHIYHVVYILEWVMDMVMVMVN